MHMKWVRKVGGIGVLGAGLIMAGLIPGTAAWGAQGNGKPPLRVGFLTILTGPAAASGQQMLDGVKMYLAQHHNQIDGRAVKLYARDTAGKPANDLTDLRKMVEQDHIDVLIGPFLANEGYAVSPYVRKHKLPWISPVTAADQLTQRQLNPYLVRMGWSSSQATHPLGDYAYKKLGYRRVAVIGSDYAFSYEVVGGFQSTFEADGGKVVQKLWTPFGTQDFAPYLSRLDRHVDAIFVTMTGADVIRFLRQYHEFGMKIPLVGGPLMSDASMITSLPKSAAGMVDSAIWDAWSSRPEAQQFVKEFKARYHMLPGYYAESCYDALAWLKKAVEAVHGDTSNKKAFMHALLSVSLPNAPRGPLSVDKYHNAVQNIYIRRVTLKDGHLINKVIYTYPHVSQFWKWSPKAYMAKPAYSRTYPPCKYCK